MKLTSLTRSLSSLLAVGLFSSTFASAGVIHTGTPVHNSRTGKPIIYLMGSKPATSCPSSYYECLTVTTTTPATQQWCVAYSGGSDCSDPYPGTWAWSASAFTVNGGRTKKTKGVYSPNPGNPTTLTISTNVKRKSHGKVKFVVELSVCNSVSSCIGPIDIGIIIG